MPFRPPDMMSLDTLNASAAPTPDSTNDSESRVSFSFPTFANPPNMGTVTVDPDRITVDSSPPPREAWREILGVSHSPEVDPDKQASLHWNGDGDGDDTDKGDFDYSKGDDDFLSEDSHTGTYIPRCRSRDRPHSSGSKSI